MAVHWLGVVGRNGSGKSTVCEYLVSKGYRVFSLSDVVRQYATREGKLHDRDTLTQLANQLKATHGADYFARCAQDDARAIDQQPIVFDSIRHPDELHYLKSHQVQFIGVHAPLSDCYERIIRRGKGTDFVSFDEFKRQDAYEMKGQSFGQLIEECLLLCDVRIDNDGDLRNLYDRLDDMLTTMDNAHVK